MILHRLVQVVHVRGMMTIMMNLHRARIDVRLQRIVGVAESVEPGTAPTGPAQRHQT